MDSGPERNREAIRRALQTVSFIAAAALLAMVLYTSFLIQGNRRTEERARATATAQERVRLTAAPQTTAAAQLAALAQEMEGLRGTPVALPAEPITPENARRLQQVARWGRGVLTGMAWSPDGHTLAVGSSVGVQLYDAATLAELRFLETHGGAGSMAFSPDGLTLAVADGVEVQLWRVADGSLERPASGPVAPFPSVGFSRAGELLAVWWDTHAGGLFLWRDGEQLPLAAPRALPAYPAAQSTAGENALAAPAVVLAVSPGGSYVAAGWPLGVIQVWRVEDAAFVASASAGAGAVTDLGFSPDSQTLASATDDGTLRVWRAADGALVSTLEWDTGVPSTLAFSPDGLLATLASGTLRLWDWAGGEMVGVQVRTWPNEPYSRLPRLAAFSPDGRLLALGNPSSGQVLLWENAAGVVLHTWLGFSAPLSDVAFSSDGRSLATRSVEAGVGWLWDVAEGRPVHKLSLPETRSAPTGGGLAFSADGLFIAGGAGNAVVLWSAEDGGLARTLISDPQQSEPSYGGLYYNSVAFSADGVTLAGVTDDGSVHLWQVAAGRELASLRPRAYVMLGATSVAVAPDGARLAVASPDGTVWLWTISDRTAISVERPGEWLGDVAFSPDGQLLAAWAAEGTVHLWQVVDGTLVHTLEAPDRFGGGLAFSPDGRLLAAGMSDGRLCLWRVEDGAPVAVLTAHASVVGGVAFSPDGRFLATVSEDGTVRLWGVR